MRQTPALLSAMKRQNAKQTRNKMTESKKVHTEINTAEYTEMAGSDFPKSKASLVCKGERRDAISSGLTGRKQMPRNK